MPAKVRLPSVVSPLLERSSTWGFGCLCLPWSNYIHLVISFVGFATASSESTARGSGHLGFDTQAWGAQHLNELAALEVDNLEGLGKKRRHIQDVPGRAAWDFALAREEILRERPSFGWCDPSRVWVGTGTRGGCGIFNS